MELGVGDGRDLGVGVVALAVDRGVLVLVACHGRLRWWGCLGCCWLLCGSRVIGCISGGVPVCVSGILRRDASRSGVDNLVLIGGT